MRTMQLIKITSEEMVQIDATVFKNINLVPNEWFLTQGEQQSQIFTGLMGKFKITIKVEKYEPKD